MTIPKSLLPLSFNHYADEVGRTAAHPTRSPEDQIPVFALGVAGEAGEVVEIVKKWLAHGLSTENAQTKLLLELGDVLWYVSALAELFGIRLEDVALANVEKLRKRHPEGFQIKGESDARSK